MAGAQLTRPETAGGHDGARLTRGWRLKELLTAGPHLSVSGAKKKRERRACWASGCGVGPHGPVLLARERRKANRPGVLRAGLEREREREGEKSLSFFSNFFQIHFSNIQTQIKQKSMHSNHDAQALIFSKLF
jgi:hypothetical protein